MSLIFPESATNTTRKSCNSRIPCLTILIMSTEIHDAIQAWLIKQLLEWSQDGQVTRKEADLNLQVGTSTLSHIYLNSLN